MNDYFSVPFIFIFLSNYFFLLLLFFLLLKSYIVQPIQYDVLL